MRIHTSRSLVPGSLALVAVGLWTGCRVVEPTAPTGGEPPQLDATVFAQDIEPILQQRGCSNVACHGGQGSGELLLSGGLDVAADLTAVAGFVLQGSPADSPVLRKPLAETAGGDVHAGGDIFADTGDEDYLRVLSWIAGEVLP